MRSQIRTLAAGLAMLACSAPSATAEPITVLSSTRVVYAAASTSGDSADEDRDADLDRMTVIAVESGLEPNQRADATASLTSSIDRRRFAGEGNLAANASGPSPARGVAHSGYDVSFQLATDHMFRLDATFFYQHNAAGANPVGVPVWELSLSNSFGTPFFLGPTRGFSTHAIEAEGTLPAGIYRFLVRTMLDIESGGTIPGAFAGVNSPFALTLEDTGSAPVPEPGSMLLLGTGLLGLARVLQQRRARPREQ